MDKKNILEFGCGREYTNWMSEEYSNYHIDCVEPFSQDEEDFSRFERITDNLSLHQIDIFSFLENNYETKYDYIYSNNVIEHIHHTKYQYLFYMLFMNSNPNAKMLIVTADLLKLADEIKKLDPERMNSKEFTKKYIKTNYAVYADGSPHVSIVTPDLLKYHIEVENLWKVESITYNNEEDPWEVAFMCRSNKTEIDKCRKVYKNMLLK